MAFLGPLYDMFYKAYGHFQVMLNVQNNFLKDVFFSDKTLSNKFNINMFSLISYYEGIG